MILIFVVGLTDLKSKRGCETAFGESRQDLGKLRPCLSSGEFPLSKAGLDS